MSPVRKQDADVSISSMATKDIDTMILLGLVVCFLIVGATITIVVYCFVIKRRRKAVSTECLATPIDTSCSYIHYGSPGNSIRATRRKRKKTERKDSEYSYSLYSSNNSSSDIGDEFMSFRDESPAPTKMQLKILDNIDKTEIDENEATCVEVGKEENHSQGLNTCRNLSFNVSELGLTGSSVLNPTSLQITASTSLCEQCLSPPPSPPPMLGTSISLPPTTVEITKTALGISTHVVPAVCDTCLSPSKLGDTTRSLNLPVLGIENDIRQRKMSPSGIITNPRVKNPMLTTLRETMSNDQLSTLFVNIDVDEKSDTAEEKDLQENSFDSLLSPSRACEWLSSDPFELSSDEENSPNDPRMIKIKPVIKTKTKETRNETYGRRGRSEDFNLPLKPQDKPCYTRSSSCYEGPSTGFITPPLRNQSRINNMSKDIFTLPGLSPGSYPGPPVKFQKFPLQETPTLSPHLIPSPVISDKFPLILPPSPFRSKSTSPGENNVSSIISDRKGNSIANITPNKSPLGSQFPGLVMTTPSQSQDSSTAIRRMHSSTAVKSRLHSLDPSCSSTATDTDTEVFDSSFSKVCNLENPSHLAWDSTFETLKTLECSMKLELTPLQKKVVEEYEDSPHDSNDSQISQCPVDKSCVSAMSLAWDNTGEVLAVTPASPESLNSSLQSMDIDEIIGRVAPNLSQPDCGNIQNDTNTIANSYQVTMIPFLKRSATSIDMDALLDIQEDYSGCDSSCKNVEAEVYTFQQAGQKKNEIVSQPFPFNAPSPHSHAPVFVFSSSMSTSDTVPYERSPSSGSHHSSSKQPCSPYSCVSEDFMSTIGSMDSFSTVFEM